MIEHLLVRSVEIATDYVDAAGPEHPLVPPLVDAMRSALADRDATDDVRLDRLAAVVDGTQALADELGLVWRPTPVVRSALGRG